MKCSICIAVAIGVVWLAGCTTHSFKESDIPAIQERVKNGLTLKIGIRSDPDVLEEVRDVTLMKVSDRKLQGYATVKISTSHPDPSGHGRIYWTDRFMTKSCEVTMAQDSDEYLWKCD